MISQIEPIASTSPHTRARSNARALDVVEKHRIVASIVARVSSRVRRARHARQIPKGGLNASARA